MSTEKENKLQFFRDKALQIIKKESELLKSNDHFIKDNAMIRKTRRFLTDNAIEACISDKTNRFVIANSASLLERAENILINRYFQLPAS